MQFAQNLWLPYFSLKDETLPLKVKSAKGCEITLENGKVLVDAISSWWAVCHGYLHPHIVERLVKQAETLPHIMLGGLLHEPALEFSHKLIKFLETQELSRVFFSDSGSTAVEVALKMAIQFFRETGRPEKNKIIYFEEGYHGETFGALSVSHSVHSFFPPITNTILRKIPETEEEFVVFEEFLNEKHKDIAGSIIEPLLQGAGGMKFHEPAKILKLWQLLKKYDVLVIADECATGFYRTGEKFAFKKIGLEPDILILGKALTAGYVPFAATVAKEFIFEGICRKNRFFHGPTFMGNPLACSAAIASLELFEKEDYSVKVALIESFFAKEFKSYEGRVMGAVCAFDITLKQNLELKKKVANGLTNSFLRPFGTTLYSIPPLIINNKELEVIAEDIKLFLSS